MWEANEMIPGAMEVLEQREEDPASVSGGAVVGGQCCRQAGLGGSHHRWPCGFEPAAPSSEQPHADATSRGKSWDAFREGTPWWSARLSMPISVSQKAVQTLPPHCCPTSAGLTGADALFASGISGNQVNRAGVVSEPPSIHATVLLPEGEFAWRWLSSWT